MPGLEEITLVTAVTPPYIEKLRWCLPTWKRKPQFRARPLLIFFSGMSGKSLLRRLPEWENVIAIPWEMPGVEGEREKMLSAFVLGAARHVKTPWSVKLDADTYFTDGQDVFVGEDAGHSLVSHRWGYTKPGWWMDSLDAWAHGKSYDGPRDKAPARHARIRSTCCLVHTEFLREAARLAGDRLPVPSHDTYLWWLAENVNEFSWRAKNLNKLGVGHNPRMRGCREAACASAQLTEFDFFTRVLDHVQLEITTECNLFCPNCDRNCGTAPDNTRMTLAQVAAFVHDSREHEWKRIDVLGGEPTLHPELREILGLLAEYRKQYPKCRVRLTTNGTGRKVRAALSRLPDWVRVRDSSKEKRSPNFEAVNEAPVDQGVENPLSCSIPWRCGLALTPRGWFLCGAGAGVDRVFRLGLGLASLSHVTPEALDEQRKALCALCGHSRSCVRLTREQATSKSWAKAFAEWNSGA